MTVLAHAGELHPVQFLALAAVVLLPAVAVIVAAVIASRRNR